MSCASKATAPLSGVTMPEDHAEGGGLAGAVAAEQADDLLLGQDEADLVDDGRPL